MGRVTIALSSRDHLALKLLALQREQKLVTVIQQAIREYLDTNGAYDLCIQSNNPKQDDP